MTHIARALVLNESTDKLPRRLVCFSHLRWNFVFQRPQHLLTRAAKVFDVSFFEEPLHENCPHPHLRLEQSEKVVVATPILPHGCVGAEALEAQQELVTAYVGGSDFVAWYYTPMARAFTAHLKPVMVVYDNMDELSAFKNAPVGLIEAEQQLLAAADVVFTGGRSLFEAKKNRHENIHCFPSSIDRKHFDRARRNADDPADQRNIAHPRIGFFGVIDERMDISLVAALADARPDWQFVILGPVVKIDATTLPRRPNLHWLGGKKYSELPVYLAHWQAGMMPFAINESTEFISPTKTPEFLAAGVPVVSTPIRDVVSTYGNAGVVEIAASPEAFIQGIEHILSGTPGRRAEWLAAADRLLATHSWDRTWEEMHLLMRAAAVARDELQAADCDPSPSTDGTGNV
jgi:glycosyltransferase involved in cell wall biosynthesis